VAALLEGLLRVDRRERLEPPGGRQGTGGRRVLRRQPHDHREGRTRELRGDPVHVGDLQDRQLALVRVAWPEPRLGDGPLEVAGHRHLAPWRRRLGHRRRSEVARHPPPADEHQRAVVELERDERVPSALAPELAALEQQLLVGEVAPPHLDASVLERGVVDLPTGCELGDVDRLRREPLVEPGVLVTTLVEALELPQAEADEPRHHGEHEDVRQHGGRAQEGSHHRRRVPA
jgi:hypothetical protein